MINSYELFRPYLFEAVSANTQASELYNYYKAWIDSVEYKKSQSVEVNLESCLREALGAKTAYLVTHKQLDEGLSIVYIALPKSPGKDFNRNYFLKSSYLPVKDANSELPLVAILALPSNIDFGSLNAHKEMQSALKSQQVLDLLVGGKIVEYINQYGITGVGFGKSINDLVNNFSHWKSFTEIYQILQQSYKSGGSGEVEKNVYIDSLAEEGARGGIWFNDRGYFITPDASEVSDSTDGPGKMLIRCARAVMATDMELAKWAAVNSYKDNPDAWLNDFMIVCIRSGWNLIWEGEVFTYDSKPSVLAGIINQFSNIKSACNSLGWDTEKVVNLRSINTSRDPVQELWGSFLNKDLGADVKNILSLKNLAQECVSSVKVVCDGVEHLMAGSSFFQDALDREKSINQQKPQPNPQATPQPTPKPQPSSKLDTIFRKQATPQPTPKPQPSSKLGNIFRK